MKGYIFPKNCNIFVCSLPKCGGMCSDKMCGRRGDGKLSGFPRFGYVKVVIVVVSGFTSRTNKLSCDCQKEVVKYDAAGLFIKNKIV